jgi:hypothetical protein
LLDLEQQGRMTRIGRDFQFGLSLCDGHRHVAEGRRFYEIHQRRFFSAKLDAKRGIASLR